jgi:multidrug resistance efflux pump
MSELRIANCELEKGIVALKAGQRKVARRLLARAACADPENATAWLWLSRCVEDEAQRRECLERALHLDPANEAVRQALGREAGTQLRRIVEAGVPATSRAFHSAPEVRDIETPLHALPGGPELQPRAEESRVAGTPSPSIPVNLSSSTPREPGEGETTSRNTRRAIRVRFNLRRLLLMALAVAVVGLACALAPRVGWPASQAQPVGGESLTASGVIQAEEVLIASEWGGCIAAIPPHEGGAVAAGDVVVQLDTSLLDAQIQAARAAIAVAKAGLAQVEAGARPGQIAIAEAGLVQAKAARGAALQAISDTLVLVENPQDIRLQIAVTQAEAEAAQHHVARAVAVKDAAEIGKDKFESVQNKWGEGSRHKVLVRSGPVSELPAILPPEIVDILPTLGDGVHKFGELELHLHGETYDIYKWISARDVRIPFELHLMPNRWWQAWVGVSAAVTQQEGLQASLAHLYAQRAHPQSLEAEADEALAALAQAEAQVVAAQAQVDGLKAGATVEQVAALEARVAQAQAALDSLLSQRAMLEVTSPMDGIVVDMTAHLGEVVAPGAPLLTVADLSEMHLTVYLPETHIGRIHLGQRVRVAVDSFSGQVFEGQVIHIADRAEFTPRNVATKEERVNLVFAVKVRLPNDDGALKPGMPADVEFGN